MPVAVMEVIERMHHNHCCATRTRSRSQYTVRAHGMDVRNDQVAGVLCGEGAAGMAQRALGKALRLRARCAHRMRVDARVARVLKSPCATQTLGRSWPAHRGDVQGIGV